jgi:hypothetical protein
VVDNVAREDGKGGVWDDFLDGLIHALLETHGDIAVVVTIGTGRALIVARLVCLGIRPLLVSQPSMLSIAHSVCSHLPAADGLGTVGV